MNEYSEELEFSNLRKYGEQLKLKVNTPLSRVGESSELNELMNVRRKLYIVVQRFKIEQEWLLFVDRASRITWNIDEYKRCLTNEFRRLVRKHFFVFENPQDCSTCDEHCFADRCCVTLSSELNIYGCVQHACVHECIEKKVVLGKRKISVSADCPCRVPSAQTDLVCVFSGKVIGKRLLESCSSSKDFTSDDSFTRSKAGFNFRLSMIEYDSIQDEYTNTDALAHRKKRNRIINEKSEQKPLSDKPKQPDVESFFDNAPQVWTKNEGEKEDAENNVPSLEQQTSAASSQDVMKNTDEANDLEQEKRNFLNSNNYFQFKRDAIINEAERYLVGFAETIMLDLLYDNEARELLNSEQIFRISSEMTSSLSSYHAAQKRAKEVPNLVTCWAAFHTPRMKLKMLKFVKYDRLQIAMFSERAVELWKLCFRSPAFILGSVETCTFKKFAVALLYCMKTGISIPRRGLAWAEKSTSDRIYVVKHEETLENDLPNENQLRWFGKTGKEAVRKVLQTGSVGSVVTVTSSTHQKLGESFAKQQQHPRITHIDTIPQRIQVDGAGSILCKTFLPNYLQEEIIGDTNSYSSSDVSTGMTFFKDCIASFSEESRNLLAFV